MRVARIAAVVAICQLLAACSGGNNNGNPAPPSATVTGVSISGTTALTAAGQSQQLAAVATLSNGTSQNVTTSATWQSSNTAVATVAPGGLVTAVSFGQATITATYQSVSGTATVVFQINLNGQTWRGTGVDSSGTTQFTALFAQTGATVSGNVTYAASGNISGSGTFTGTVGTTENTISFTIIASGSGCSITVTGTATVTTTSLSGTYSGTNSCSGALTGGQVNLTKQ